MSTEPHTSQSKPLSGIALWAPALAATISSYSLMGDSAMFSIAQTQIMKDFGIQIGLIQFALILVQVVGGPFALIAGRLSDVRGKRRIFLIGAALFGLGQLLTGLAPNIYVLILGYSLLRGIAINMVITSSMGLMVHTYRDNKTRGQAFGLYGVAVVVAGVLPSLYMGASVDYLSWRLPFILHALLFAGAFLMVWRLVDEAPLEKGQRVDGTGAMLAYLALVPLLLSPTLARQYGWVTARRPFFIGDVQFNPLGLSPVAILLLLGVILSLIMFWWLERKEARGGQPLFRPSVFQDMNFTGAIASITVFYMLASAYPFILNNFLQGYAGWSALSVSLVLIALAVTSLISGPPSGRLLERFAPKHVLQGSFVIVIIGILWMVANVTSLDVGPWAFIGPFLVLGLGFGVIGSQMNNIALLFIPPHRASEASGILELGKDIGLALGVAVIGSLMVATTLGSTVDGILKVSGVAVTPEERQALIIELEDAQAQFDQAAFQKALQALPPDVQDDVVSVLRQAPVDGFRTALVGLIGAVVLAILITLIMPTTRPSIEKPLEGGSSP